MGQIIMTKYLKISILHVNFQLSQNIGIHKGVSVLFPFNQFQDELKKKCKITNMILYIIRKTNIQRANCIISFKIIFRTDATADLIIKFFLTQNLSSKSNLIYKYFKMSRCEGVIMKWINVYIYIISLYDIQETHNLQK